MKIIELTQKKNAYEKCVVSSRPLTIDTEPVDS